MRVTISYEHIAILILISILLMIRQKDIGANTSNMFIDTLNISNLYLDGIGGDYDGVIQYKVI